MAEWLVRLSELAEFLLIRDLFVIFINALYRAIFLRCSRSYLQNEAFPLCKTIRDAKSTFYILHKACWG